MASVMLVSGGLDSLAAWRLADLPLAVYVNVGNRAQEREERAVDWAADTWGGQVVRRTCVMPEMGNGYVPHRNAIIILLAAQHGDTVTLGKVAEWAPDKNRRFLHRLERLGTQGLRGEWQGLGKGRRLRISTPWDTVTKRGLLTAYQKRFGATETKALWDRSWSCYGAGPEWCWECSGCAQRVECGLPGNRRASARDAVRWVRDDGLRAPFVRVGEVLRG